MTDARKYTIGALSGAFILTLVVPAVAQMSNAAGLNAAVHTKTQARPVPTQACVQAMVGLEDAHIAYFDTESAARKTAMQAHNTAMKAAADITDDAQRQTAVQKANQDFAAAMKAVMTGEDAATKTASDAVQSACGNARGMHARMGGKMKAGFMGGHRGAEGNEEGMRKKGVPAPAATTQN